MFMVPKNIDPSLAMFLSTAPAIEVRFPVDIEEIADILSDILDDQY